MKSEQVTLRSIRINGHPYVGNNSGFFHRWCTGQIFDFELTHIRTMAIVELIDGKIKLIEPQYLQFTEPYKR